MLKKKVLVPGGRSGQIFEIFEILGRAGDINISIGTSNYQNGPYHDIGIYVKARMLALGPRFGRVLGPQGSLLWLPEVAIWKIFEILSGLIYIAYQVQPTTCLKSFHFLCTYPRKVFSALAEVWSIPWPSTTSIMAPGGRDLDDF